MPSQAANASTASWQYALRSSGLRLVTRVFGPAVQICTSSSTQVAPALRRSVLRLGHEVRVRPRTTSASTRVHGAWQIAATGLPAVEERPRTKSTAVACVRRKSGLATPPGSDERRRTRPRRPRRAVASTGKVSAFSRWLTALDAAGLGGDEAGCAARLLDRLPRLGQLDLFDHRPGRRGTRWSCPEVACSWVGTSPDGVVGARSLLRALPAMGRGIHALGPCGCADVLAGSLTGR